jgi:hypothetical protein
MTSRKGQLFFFDALPVPVPHATCCGEGACWDGGCNKLGLVRVLVFGGLRSEWSQEDPHDKRLAGKDHQKAPNGD